MCLIDTLFLTDAYIEIGILLPKKCLNLVRKITTIFWIILEVFFTVTPSVTPEGVSKGKLDRATAVFFEKFVEEGNK